MTSKPSAGAVKAARRILEKFGTVHEHWLTWCADVIESEAHCGELADALLKYGAHYPSCIYKTVVVGEKWQRVGCTCGFEAVLKKVGR